MLFPGKICSNHSSLATFVYTSSNSAQCQLSFFHAWLIKASMKWSSLSSIQSLASHCFSGCVTHTPDTRQAGTLPEDMNSRLRVLAGTENYEGPNWTKLHDHA